MPPEMDPSWFNTNVDYNDTFNKAALQGVDVKTATGGLHALSGVDLNDPTSLNNAIGNLIKTNNLDKATSLINVQGANAFSKNILPLIQEHFASASQSGGGKGGGAAPTLQPPAVTPQSANGAVAANPQGGEPGHMPAGWQPASAEDNAAIQTGLNKQGQAALDSQHMAETMSLAKGAVDQLAQLPQEQRAAAADALGQQLKDRGVPEMAVDSNMKSLADAGFSDEALKDKAAFFDAHAQHFDAHAQGQTPDASQLPTQPGMPWYSNISNDPFLNDPLIVGGLKKYLGIDIEPQLTRAAQLAMPGITKDEEEAHAAGIAAKTAAGKLPYDVAEKAAEAHIEVAKTLEILQNKNKNEISNLYVNGDANRPISLTTDEAVKRINNGEILTSQPSAISRAAGEARGNFLESPHEFKGQDEFGNAVTRTMTGSERNAAIAMGVSPAKIGMTPSEQDLKWKDLGIANLGDVVKAATTNIQAYPKDDLANHQLLSLANAVGTGPYTKTLSQVANDLAPILGNGAIKDYASDAPLLAQTLSQYTRSQFNGALPRIRSEFETVTSGLPKNTSPQDQIKIDALLNIGKRNYDNEMNEYFVNNSDNLPQKSPQAAQIAWDAQQGGRSILSYALPELQKTTINGKPAIGPIKEYQGHKWAQFMPGSSHPIKIMIE